MCFLSIFCASIEKISTKNFGPNEENLFVWPKANKVRLAQVEKANTNLLESDWPNSDKFVCFFRIGPFVASCGQW